jgi:serine/threonine protein kinase
MPRDDPAEISAMSEQPKRGVLMGLAAEGIVPVLGGCAGALAGGPEGGMVAGVVGVAVGQAVEKVINFFGARIVQRWGNWLRTQPVEVREQALAELASLPADEARQQAESLLDKLVLEPIDQADREVAISYLSLLPGALDRALPRDMASGGRAIPPTVSEAEAHQLLSLMPISLPPYPVGSEVPGTPYRLDALLGSGGFGAVYRASTRSLQHLPLAIKFCLDPNLAQALHRERSNLERLMKAGGENWSPRIVRLYGYDLEHKTPYLVYEYVTGGDLIRHLAERRENLGRGLNAQEVFDLMVQVTEALAFAHEHGLVHRDLKPANVLVEGGVPKLADFGLGGVSAVRAAQVSRIGATTIDQLSVADQASLFRGAGTPLYMAPEQRRGQAPDPRHDLYSLGVMWYQLLVGDVSRELHPGWAKELVVRHSVPRRHIELIEGCVGWFDERPRNAGELLRLMREKAVDSTSTSVADFSSLPAIGIQAVDTPRSPEMETARPVAMMTAVPADRLREELLCSLVKSLEEQLLAFRELDKNLGAYLGTAGGVGVAAFFVIGGMSHNTWGALFAALLVSGLVGGALFFIRLGRRGEAREQVKLTIQTLTREFPDVVRSWGGESVLHNPQIVSQIARRLGLPPPPEPEEEAEEPPPVSRPAVEVPDLEPAQRKALLAQLRPVAEEQKQADGFGQRRPFPLVLALLIGLIFGGPVGVALGHAFYFYYGPVEDGPTFNRVYFDNKLNPLSDGAYIIDDRRSITLAVALGIATGLTVFGVVFSFLTRRSWYRLRLFLGLLLGLLVGAPVGVGVGALNFGLFGPYETGPSLQRTYYDGRGNTLTHPAYLLEERRSIISTLILGIGSGSLVAFFIMMLFQRRYDRRATEARQQVRGSIQRLEKTFPEVVASQGGTEALLEPGKVGELLSAVEAKA